MESNSLSGFRFPKYRLKTKKQDLRAGGAAVNQTRHPSTAILWCYHEFSRSWRCSEASNTTTHTRYPTQYTHPGPGTLSAGSPPVPCSKAKAFSRSARSMLHRYASCVPCTASHPQQNYFDILRNYGCGSRFCDLAYMLCYRPYSTNCFSKPPRA